MNYQNTVRRRIRRSNIKYLVLYAILALITGAGAYTFFTEGTSMQLLDLIPIPSVVSGAIFLVLCAFLVTLCGQTFAAIVRDRPFKHLTDTIRSFGNPDEVFAYIEEMPKSDLCIHGDFRCDKNYIAFSLADLALVQQTRNLVWGYLQAPSSKGSSKKPVDPNTKDARNVVLRFKNRDTVIVQTKSRENADKLLEQMQKYAPSMTSGYSYKLETLYKKDPEKLRKHPSKTASAK